MPSVEIRAFVFTDIVGSTRLKKRMPGRENAQRDYHFAEQILRPHRKLIEEGLAEHEGRIVSTQGDGHFLEFKNPIQAVNWAIEVQQLHAEQPIHTPDDHPLGIKIGIHMGPASADPNEAGNYIGTSVDYAARLVQLATARQIIVSEVVATFVREEDIADIRLHEHGLHELSGIGQKLVFEIIYDDQQPSPLNSASSSSPAVGSSSPPDSSATAATLNEPLAGLRIKDYELLEEIAEGGMGKVFKARHVGMGRICVLKLIKDSLLGPGNQEILERFYREINVVARLKHPNIIQAYHSSSRDDQYHFLVLEYLDGVTLDRLVKDGGPLPLGKACELVRQTANGLQYIHAHGLVHRDIKPSNLMLANDGNSEVIKILDLGLALLLEDNVDRITQHDQRAMGTAYYMAPEQWASTTVDIRADIYSLGCTFYHLVAGHPPFQNSNYNQEYAHRTVAPPALDATTDVPDQLWRVIQKMLAKRPEDRYAEPSQLCEALDTFSSATTIAPVNTPGIVPKSLPQPSSAKPARPNDDTIVGTDPGESTTPASQLGPAKWQRRWLPWHVAVTGLLIAWLMVRGMNDDGTNRVVDSPQHAAAARHFLLAMPGMNGEWWFDEIPWFFPEMRLHLLKHLSVADYQQLRELANKPEVPAFYKQLQSACESSLNIDAADPLVTRFNLLKAARPFDEVPQKKESSIWGRVDTALEQQREGPDNFTPEDLHLRGLLNWKMRLPDSVETLAAARGPYDSVSKELKSLCRADAGVVFQRQRKWGDAGLEYDAARSSLPDKRLAPHLVLFTLAMEAEVRLFDPKWPRGDIPALFQDAQADSVLGHFDPNHPLAALLISREALYFLETWQLERAEQKGQEAYKTFSQNQGRFRATNLYFRSRQFMALAYHFLGKSEDAQREFRGLLSFIDDLLNSDQIANQEKPQWQRLQPNLLGRLGDVLLFGQGDAVGAADVLKQAASQARRFEGGPKAAYLARIRFKLATAQALAGDLNSAQNSHAEAMKIVASVNEPRQTKIFHLFQEIASALLDEDGRRQKMVEFVQNTTSEDEEFINRDRDDLQLLLFACEYILARQPDPLDEGQRADIEKQKANLSKRVGNDGQAYLDNIARAAQMLAAETPVAEP